MYRIMSKSWSSLWMTSLMMVAALPSAFANNDLFNLETGQATDYLKRVLEILDFQPEPLAPGGDPFHIQNLNANFGKSFYVEDPKYFDNPDNPELYLSKKFDESESVKRAVACLDLIYASRNEYFPVNKRFENALLTTGEVEPSIRRRLNVLKDAHLRGYTFDRIWYIVGSDETKALLEALLKQDEFKSLEQTSKVEIVVTNTKTLMWDVGLEKTRTQIHGTRVVIGDGTFAEKQFATAQMILGKDNLELFSIAEKDWRKDMQSFRYIEKYRGDERHAILAWLGGELNFGIARKTHTLLNVYKNNHLRK